MKGMSASLTPELYRKTVTTLRVGVLCLFFWLFCQPAAAPFASDHINAFSAGNNVVDYTPVQGYFLPLKLRRDTLFEYTCNECHRVFDTDEKRKQRIAEHVDLTLNHGKTIHCLNCHHKTNRNAYTTNNGQEIPSDRPEELCSQCHGTTYRDWKAGAHGRAIGRWDGKGKGRNSLVCTECHNPHNPEFPQLVPMAGPAIPGRKAEKRAH